jgi:hypothetical protein
MSDTLVFIPAWNAGGVSKLRGGRAVKLVLTVAATLAVGRLLRSRRSKALPPGRRATRHLSRLRPSGRLQPLGSAGHWVDPGKDVPSPTVW